MADLDESPLEDSNPRKRRRLNSNLATTNRIQTKNTIAKLENELNQCILAKDVALKELGKIKSSSIEQIKLKNIEINNLQKNLQDLYHQNELNKNKYSQLQNTLNHKIEIFESQINKLNKEKQNQNDQKPVILHSNINNNNNKNEYNKLKNEIKLKSNTIELQNNEILRLENEFKKMQQNTQNITNLWQKSSKQIQRLQTQINNKKRDYKNIVKSEMENITEDYERKIRLLNAELSQYKNDKHQLNIITEEYEICKSQNNSLKIKINKLIQLNTNYEPIQNELNEWKNIIKSMFIQLNGNNASIQLNNEYDLKIALKSLNNKYITLISEKDEYKSNYIICNNKLSNTKIEYNKLKLKYDNILELNNKYNTNLNKLNNELNELKNDNISYKNILNRYNVMSPSKNAQQLQIIKLNKENQKLTELNTKNEKEIERCRKIINKVKSEMKKVPVEMEDISSKDELHAMNTKILHFKHNPFDIALNKKKNEKDNRIKELENKIVSMENILKNNDANNCINIDDNDDDDNKEVKMKLIINQKYYELSNKYKSLLAEYQLKCSSFDDMLSSYESIKKVNLRIKEIFGKKAGEYRERIYQMTGYNICLLGDGKHYRLKHIWMDHPDDEIILKIDKFNSLECLDTDFVRNKVNKKIIKKLQTIRSLPIFLSQLTLDLYTDNENNNS